MAETSSEPADAAAALPRTDLDLEAEMQELQEFVRTGPSFMNRAVWLDLDEFEGRMQRILGHLPREIQRARRIARDERQILQDATEEARRVIAEARAEAEELLGAARQEAERIVDQSSIKQLAVSQAEEIVQQAQGTAHEIRARGFAYARDALQALDATIEGIRQQVRAGQEQLRLPEEEGR
jgi:hypothetical protein